MDTRELVRRFQLERQTLANLRHPHIATLIDGGVSDRGQPYLVMEYIDGKPIDRYCDDTRLGVPGRLELIRTVCTAVQYAHQNLVVHRDIKPNNILVTSDGTLKLVDFGISKLLGRNGSTTGARSATGATATGYRLVTPQYASPEVIRGEPASTAMDVYSVGLVMYELLTGRRPYELKHQSPREIERVVCDLDPAPPSSAITQPFELEAADGSTRTITPAALCDLRCTTLADLRRTLRGDLDTLVLSALHKDPSRRYASVEQLSEDIKRYLGGFPIRARKDSVAYRSWKFFRRHRVAAVAAIAVVLSLMAGTGAATYGLMSARRDAVRARLEAAKAERINEFLHSILAAADPEIGNADIRVRDVLDQAALRIEGELADEPQVRAAVLTTLGETYHNLGLDKQAEPQLREALTIRRELLGSEHPETAASMTQLGLALRMIGQYAEAGRLIQEALAFDTRYYGRRHPSVVRDLNALAEVQVDTSELAASEASLRESLGISRALQKGDDLDTAQGMEKLGVVLALQGKVIEAEPLCRGALAMNRRLVGDEHPRIAHSLRRLAIALQQRGSLEEAETLYLQALELDRRQLGSDHHNIARILNNLGLLVADRGRVAEGQEMLRQSLALRRKLFGDEHLTVASTLSNLATLLDAVDAEPLLRESLAISRKLFGNDHVQVGHSCQNLAACMKTLGDYAAAEPLFHEALAMYRKHFGEQHPRVAFPLLGIGEVLVLRGRFAEAEPWLRESLARRESAYASGHPLIGAVQGVLADDLIGLSRPNDAEPLAIASWDALQRDVRATTDDRLAALRRLVTVYHTLNDLEQAGRYRKLLPLPEDLAGPSPP